MFHFVARPGHSLMIAGAAGNGPNGSVAASQLVGKQGVFGAAWTVSRIEGAFGAESQQLWTSRLKFSVTERLNFLIWQEAESHELGYPTPNGCQVPVVEGHNRSEEHTSELQSLM